ncbi:MAG: thiaminase II [Candidatus Nitrosopolaris wilkensis]|nr:MAG: thiaminase II [Candidatus Nitrosopolaris wilkensis]
MAEILSHRFVMELSSEILPLNKFVFYLRQDHYFLGEFSKFLHSAKQKTNDNKLKEWLDRLYLNTFNFERETQRQLLDVLGVSLNYPSNTANHEFFPCRTTLNYTSYLMNTSSNGTFSDIVSVMAPCPWTYLEIAQKLAKIHIGNEAYSKWVQFYSSTESNRQVAEIKEILNKLGEKEDEKSKAKMKNHFANACKYEYLFWEMAYNLSD